MRTLPLLASALVVSAVALQAQDTKDKNKDKPSKAESRAIIEADVAPRAYRMLMDAQSPRSMIGVSTSSSGIRDTLGLLVTSVTPNGPAEKAGIVEGNRIAAINGVNLRLAAADAGEEDMQGITARRLTRELGKVEPGTEVELRVYADGQYRNVRVKTVSRDSLMPARFFRDNSEDDRAVLGFQLSSSGSKRDTLGVFVGSIKEDGPAEKAGIVEGDRIVSVNGTDLRVNRDDVGDDWVGSTMVSRFQRVMRGVKAGDKVQLRVWSGGEVKNVSVTAVKASEVYKNDRRVRVFGRGAFTWDGTPMIAPVPAIPPMPPMPAIAPRIRINSLDMDDDDIEELDDVEELNDVDAQVDVERALDAARAAEAAAADRARASTRTFVSKAAAMTRATPVASAVWSTDMVDAMRDADAAHASTLIRGPGLSLAPVTPELAEYLGKGSENGYLVLEATGQWGALHAGDVIISVDGTCVRDSDSTPDDARELVVLRKGRKLAITR
ncbi:MAG TPA: PDZ domain-containing protein [Gemmatimonadaceae bacterium]|nr:PDZ domain-containing protein [Gemmatimonadaceae bacterium]